MTRERYVLYLTAEQWAEFRRLQRACLDWYNWQNRAGHSHPEVDHELYLSIGSFSGYDYETELEK